MSTFSLSVRVIVFCGAKKQMGWINALWHITSMAHMHAVGNFSDERAICRPMRGMQLSANPYVAISSAR
jgi:hypothetical protein